MSEIDVQQDASNSTLTIAYEPGEENVFFDLCDEGGRVVETGSISKGVVQLSMDKISGGYYTIFVVDGGVLKKKRFHLVK